MIQLVANSGTKATVYAQLTVHVCTLSCGGRRVRVQSRRTTLLKAGIGVGGALASIGVGGASHAPHPGKPGNYAG